MPLPQTDTEQKYTYADYLTWPDDERWEIIDGVAYAMSPSPGTRHQRLSLSLSLQFGNYLKGKQCALFVAPFDVRLSERIGFTDEKITTVVQPDLLVVSDKTKLDDRGCSGTPDLVIEILSPSTAVRDIKLKFDLYQQHSVKEYWLIHPAEQTLLVYKLDKTGMYGAADRYAGNDQVSVSLLGELVIDLAEVFAE